ncbi:MAG TPA: Uma2 family endonuclease [Gemmataceae bacterium]|nr:Uma2 family endonuclease [Gemmataceae bacterium]
MSVASVENGGVSVVTDEPLYEVIGDVRKELPPMSAREIVMGSVLLGYLIRHVEQQGLGRAVNEMLFDLRPTVDRSRRPDVAFVSYDRWPRTRLIPRTNTWPVVPELAVEIVSPTNGFEEVIEKMQEYFQAGSRLVWVVIPDPCEVYAYTSPTATRIFTRADELPGDPVLPGFRLPLAKLFEEGTED